MKLSELSKTGQPFAVVTAYRSAYDEKANVDRNRQLRQMLDSKGMKARQLIGRWRECQDPSIPHDECPEHLLKGVVERSYFVPKPPDMPFEEFKEAIVSFGRDFEQDSVILSDGASTKTVDCN